MTNEWFKSSFSSAGDNCVEVKREILGITYVRDSKNPDSPILGFTSDEWDAFIRGAKAGEFDF